MKVVKTLFICTVIAVLIQNLIFLYVEKIYLVNKSSYEIEKVETSGQSEAMEISINEHADDVRISYDGTFISYMLNDTLEIYNAKDNRKDTYKEVSGKLVYYKWLTDCNKIIAIEKIVKSGKQYFVPISYDAKSGQGSVITDFNMNQIKIKAKDSQKIDLIAFSTASSSLYIKIKDEDGKSDLYYANQMNELKNIESNKAIGNIVVPVISSNAVVENNNKISILNSNNSITIPNSQRPKILATDKNNKVYFCNDNNGKTDMIYYADVTEKNYKWSRFNLKNQEAISDICIDYNGKAYINYPEENRIKDIKSGTDIKYEGEFLQTYSKGIVTKKDGKIIKKKIDK